MWIQNTYAPFQNILSILCEIGLKNLHIFANISKTGPASFVKSYPFVADLILNRTPYATNLRKFVISTFA